MSDLLIRGMEMPSRCWDCDLCYDKFYCKSLEMCLLGEQDKKYRPKEYDPADDRLPNCPLISVPAHGRLIDADKMRESISRQTGLLKLMGGELSDIAETLEKGFLQEIANAPTIIPAEPFNNLSKPYKEAAP